MKKDVCGSTHSKNEGRLLNNAFTLIELLGVLIILAVIALITFLIIDNTIKNSREKSLERTILVIQLKNNSFI